MVSVFKIHKALALFLVGAALLAILFLRPWSHAKENPPLAWTVLQGDEKALGFERRWAGRPRLKVNLPANQVISMETQYITLDPQKKYRLHYHYRTKTRPLIWSGVTVEYFKPGHSLGAQSITFQDHQAEWEKKDYLLVFPETTTACKVRLRMQEAGEYWIDDMAINEISRDEAKRISFVGKMREIPVGKAAARPTISPEGKYSVRQVEGVWWLFDPAGKAFWNVSLWGGGPIGDYGELPLRRFIRDRYLHTGNSRAYENAIFDSLIAWGFNSIGAGIEIEPMNRALEMRKHDKAATLPYVDTIMLNLSLAGHHGFRLWAIAESLYGAGKVKVEDLVMMDRNAKPVMGSASLFPDVFSEKFRNAYDRYVKEWFDKRGRADLFAVCLDNELPWAELPRAIYSPACRREFASFARTKFNGRIDDYNRLYGTRFRDFAEIEINMPPDAGGVYHDLVYEFLRHYVREYFAFQLATVRKYRPAILTIGQRISCSNALDSFNQMKSIYEWGLDLFSVYDMIGLNMYPRGQDHFTPDQMKTLEYFHQKTGRPIIITEWCICCEESGVPTTVGWPLWSTVPTWEDRGNGYRNCLLQLASLPYVVGAHWFSSYNGYVWNNGVPYPAYNHGFYQDNFQPNPLFLKKAVEANRIVSQMERKAGFTINDIHYMKE